jgi:hypothetical protein
MSDPKATTPSAPATFEYEFHQLAEIFPMLEGKDLTDLADDIKAKGLLEQITLYQGKILDGRNRYRAARSVGFSLTARYFRELPSSMDPQAFVISANIHRRHLTAEQKRDLLAKLIKADPTQSNRQIAEQAKVSHVTVGTVREQLEATGQLDQLLATTGKDGKTRKTKTAKGKTEVKKQPKKGRMNGWDGYHAIQEDLIDALLEWPSSSDHALEWANKTRERLDQAIDDWCKREDEDRGRRVTAGDER